MHGRDRLTPSDSALQDIFWVAEYKSSVYLHRGVITANCALLMIQVDSRWDYFVTRERILSLILEMDVYEI